MFGQIVLCIKKDIQLDWRQKNPFLGMILYVVSTVYIIFLSYSRGLNAESWSALFWIVLLFVAASGLNKSFSQEENRSRLYYFLVPNTVMILSKLIYSIFYLLILGSISMAAFWLFGTVPQMNMGPFVVNMILGITGLASAFTFLSSLSTQTTQRNTMLAILGFPVMLPILSLAIKNSNNLVAGASWADISANSMTLLAVDSLIIALSLLLFPYSWRP